MHKGWHQVGFQRDLHAEMNPITVGAKPLLLLCRNGTFAAFDAICPHRGANLSFGGQLAGQSVICPFHGKSIGLGEDSDYPFSVQSYRVLCLGGLVFVAKRDVQDSGFERYFTELNKCHYIVPGFTLEVRAPAELVIENAFDQTHFRPVHGICNDPVLEELPSECGEFAVRGFFELPKSKWQASKDPGRTVKVSFTARAFSPTLVISELGGEQPYHMITSATQGGDEDSCQVRLSLAVKADSSGNPPDESACRYLLDHAMAGIEKDQIIWERLPVNPPFCPDATDEFVVEFRKFIKTFT